jgi:hypothetical protein
MVAATETPHSANFGEISVWEVVAENQPFCPKELFPNTTNCYLDGVLERRR